MKNILTSIIIVCGLVSISVQAQDCRSGVDHRHPSCFNGYHQAQYHGPRVVYRDSNWVAPLIIGGIVGAVIARENAPVVIQQQPVIIQQEPIQPTQRFVIIDNVVYVKQLVMINGIWQEILIKQ